MNNKEHSPTIEQSLKMIEDKLEGQKSQKKDKNLNNKKKSYSLSNLFTKKKNLKSKVKQDDVILLTKKVDIKENRNKPKKNKVFKKKVIKNIENKTRELKTENIDTRVADNKKLSKTNDLANIIKKLKDKKLNNNKLKKSKKVNKEIKKLNETINLAEDLFTKELLDL